MATDKAAQYHHRNQHCVLLTGATGSVGSHLAASLLCREDVTTIVCLNRIHARTKPSDRQDEAFRDHALDVQARHAKLRIYEADTAKPCLGLQADDYNWLKESVTDIIHNAWPMSGNRPLKQFEKQFQVMRNLIQLAYEASSITSGKLSFQFISSIAVVGNQPLATKNATVLEERVGIDSVLPNGYGDAKYTCELMLDETLHKQPDRFQTMSVRLGQVGGNSQSGYWNTAEHLSFLVKSCQTLRALPAFKGPLSWTPVDRVAETLIDLLFQGKESCFPVYNIDNPVRQPWEDMIMLWAQELDIPQKNIIPFTEWVERVRQFPGSTERDNPAFKLIDFLDDNFLRMSCGGLLLDTSQARRHSATLATVGPVEPETARRYIQYWRKIGFLSA